MSSEFWLQCEWPAGHHAVLGRTGGIQDSDGEDMDTYLVANAIAEGSYSSDSEPVKCDDPGEGTLYDTAKFCGEPNRIDALKKLGMLDTPREELFDKVTALLMKIFDTQCSHLVLIDPNRCWFKSWQGKWCDFETDTSHGRNVECPREEGWCNYILVPDFAEILVIEDATKDARLALNPFVVGPPHFRFYAGAPLVGSRGERYGTLCVADFIPRSFDADQYALLTNYAALVVEELERDKPMVDQVNESLANYVERSRYMDRSIQAMEQGICMIDMRDAKWPVMFHNPKFQDALQEPTELEGKYFWDIFNCSKQTKLEFGIATGLGDTFEMTVECASSGKELHLELLPATSDRLAPSKCTGLPSWVGKDTSSLQARIEAGKSPEIVRDCKCFWFVLISDKAPLTAGTLEQAKKDQEESAKVKGSQSTKSGGYRQERRPSDQSTGTDELSQLSASLASTLSSSWSSFYADYPLPAKLNTSVELGPLLGSGSFGKAYRATFKEKNVAVKVVDCRKRDDKAIQEQLREVQYTAAISHENIVKVLEYATSTGRTKGKQIDILWIVQELCDLGDLASGTERGLLRVERKITADPDIAVVNSVMLDIARGMEFVHKCNIIHADLTGRNVLLTSSEKPCGFTAKVTDFGLARYSLGAKSLPATDIGTITHMPPEVMDPDGGELLPK
ncbi:Serine/threonine-protein kinase ATG1a (Autophagy-related protein 1a) (AtAPG1a), partial [Durusdinium trenchii]